MRFSLKNQTLIEKHFFIFQRVSKKVALETHNPEELLRIVLHERVERLPAKRLGQLLGAHGLVAGLQLVEHPL